MTAIDDHIPTSLY